MITLVLDCDGVLYLGDTTIAGAGEALAVLDAAGHQLLFVTNNATKTAAEIARKLAAVVGYEASPDQVVGSAAAAASMLESADAPVYVVGEAGLHEAVAARGVPITKDWTTARAVVVGLNRSVSYNQISDASQAIRAGARFVAANTDPTYPTPDGLVPGAGAIVAAISAASGASPEVAGKPHTPMVDLVQRLVVNDDVWVVGDRPETDLAMARSSGWRKVLVLTGVTSSPDSVPQALAPDLVLGSIAELPAVLSRTEESGAFERLDALQERSS